MHAYSHTDFLALVSKTSSNAFMLITVDPDESFDDSSVNALERILPNLSDTIDLLNFEYGAIVVFDTIEAAMEVFFMIQQKLNELPPMGLMAMIYYEGFTQLAFSQTEMSLVDQAQPQHTIAM